ncbi:MAG: TSUP family transporter [Verrucomicrobiota bacterium]
MWFVYFVVDPKLALGTNKLQATFGSGSASWHYARAGTVSPSDRKLGFAVIFLGAAPGTWLAQRLPRDFLMRAIPVLLIVVAVYCLLKPDLGAAAARPRLSRVWFSVGFGLLLGWIDSATESFLRADIRPQEAGQSDPNV